MTPNSARPVTQPARAWLTADLGFTVLLLALFAAALVESMSFPFRAALVPRIVSGMGIVFCLLSLCRLLIAGRHTAPPDRINSSASHSVTPTRFEGAEELADDDEDYAFHTASRAEWIDALAWFGGFFLALALFGILVSVPAFALGYLIAVGRVRPWWAALYAVSSWGLLFVVFDRILHLTLPTGVLM